MISSSYFRFKKANFPSPDSNYKWTSRTSTNSSTCSWKSQPFQKPTTLSTNRGICKQFSPKNSYSKVVDDKRIRKLPVSISPPKNKIPSNGFIRYDPKTKTLLKTIDCGKTEKIRDGFSKGVVSRYKVIRKTTNSSIKNSSSAGNFKPSNFAVGKIKNGTNPVTENFKINKFNFSSSRNRSITKIDRSGAENRSITEIVSKYKLRRRVLSVSMSNFRATTRYRRLSQNFGGSVNRYKIVRKKSAVNGRKDVYKVDRRKEKSSQNRPRSLNNLSKRRWINRRKSTDQEKRDRRQCLFYIRYGRCCRGSKCQFIHDKTKIAVCTRFLRGTCQIDDCPFSHVVSPDKMPLCRFYLSNICIRDNCPYLHVKHADSTTDCLDFERGYCPKGAKCDKKHVATGRRGKSKDESVKSVVESVKQKSTGCGKNNGSVFHILRSRNIPACLKTEIQDPAMGPLPEFIPLG